MIQTWIYKNTTFTPSNSPKSCGGKFGASAPLTRAQHLENKRESIRFLPLPLRSLQFEPAQYRISESLNSLTLSGTRLWNLFITFN